MLSDGADAEPERASEEHEPRERASGSGRSDHEVEVAQHGIQNMPPNEGHVVEEGEAEVRDALDTSVGVPSSPVDVDEQVAR